MTPHRLKRLRDFSLSFQKPSGKASTPNQECIHLNQNTLAVASEGTSHASVLSCPLETSPQNTRKRLQDTSSTSGESSSLLRDLTWTTGLYLITQRFYTLTQ
ncbi:hypothetical protein DPEC_G00157170 [Dallia pectoralis]|uniref:Uncharacterized protein n=1 Tax=Dallia pectoralis TaxID=75939 RepID=A0ACC2GLF5_DALPE|nr:hypothetical protein DPEC_G00157170 [Dallia pectoralis]